MSDGKTSSNSNSGQQARGKGQIVRELDKTLDLAYGNNFEEAILEIALQIRHLIGAHQSAVSFIPDSDFKRAIHTHSFSSKYEEFNSYDVMPTGEGIWSCVAEHKVTMRLTEKELAAHPRFKNFSDMKTKSGLEHPPMPGWLAVPVLRPSGEFIGLLQLSDRYEGDFTETDQTELERIARVVGLTFELHYINSHLISAKEDVSELKTTEMLLSQERERFELAVNSASIGVWGWDLQSDELVWNDNMHLIYQTPEKVKKAGLFYGFWRESVHPDDVDAVEGSLQKAIENKERWATTFRLKLHDGTIKHIQANAIVQLNKQKQPVKVNGINIDITKQRNLESGLAKAVEAEARANRSKSQFLANMSHEIRTPMNAILGLTQVVLGLPLEEKVHKYISQISQSSRALLNILNDILDYSKIESDKLDLVYEPFSLDQVLENMVGLFSTMAHQKGLELIIDDRCSTRYFCGDPLRIGQVLSNIVGNAIKFTESGHIVVRLSDELVASDEVKLYCTVEDTGIGMNDEQVSKLFQPFTQADASIARKYEGSGLGLTISKKLLALMNGHIDVASQQGKGSQFSFDFCLQPDKKRVADRRHFDQLNALVVDDNHESLSILQAMLSSWGVKVIGFDSSFAAFKHLKETSTPYDLLLVDSLMPELDGIELLSLVQQTGKDHKHVLVMVSAIEQQRVKEHQNNGLHIDAFVEKPIIASNLYIELVKLLDLETGIEHAQQITQDVGTLQNKCAGAQVLLVEDNDVNQMVASEFLSSLEIDFDIAENGKIGVDMAQQCDYDLILMDVQMPVMDGYEASRQIRTQEKGKHTPILAMTAAALQHDKEAAKKAGMDDHIAKPIDFVELEEKMTNWLNTGIEHNVLAEQSTKDELNSEIELEGFELVQAASRIYDNWGLLVELLKRFTQSLESLRADIKNGLANDDIPLLKKALHTLRGSAASVGANLLAQNAGELEQQIDLNPSVKPNCTVMLERMDKTKAILEAADLSKLNQIEDAVQHTDAEFETLIQKMKSGGFIGVSERRTFLSEVESRLGPKFSEPYSKLLEKLQFKDAAEIFDADLARLSPQK